MDILNELCKSIENGDSAASRELCAKALVQGIHYRIILDEMLNVIKDVGQKFRTNELFVPEILIVSRAFNVALEFLLPDLKIGEDIYSETVLMGTVKGDLHDLGKNIVKLMLHSYGYKVIDLGVDVSPEEFANATRKYKPAVIAISTSITSTMIQIKRTIQLLEKEGLRDQAPILIGGYPVTANFVKNIRGDYYAEDATTAAELVINISTLKKQSMNNTNMTSTS
jgi:5-methyltetrahydrofolate--homocysteine methyltransferase